jgi:antitoxin ParD1/3/4
MNVSLTPELERFVEEKVKTGMYQTASEVVREGLRLLRKSERLGDPHLTRLRREVAVGIDQADEGRLVPFDEALIEQVKSRGRKRLAAAKRNGKR